jgi:methionyl aminopeptidase
MSHKIILKTPSEIKIMQEGGKKLARIKEQLRNAIRVGARASDIDKLASSLIKEEGGMPSFKMVKGYKWSTCINVNEGVVHGIPREDVIFMKGDIVSVDVGMFYKGFHTDTSFSVGLDTGKEGDLFLEAGREALRNAISVTTAGNYVYDISYSIESTLKRFGLSPVRDLVGHGIGRSLHEEPEIPCFTSLPREDTPMIKEGAVFAIEVMYTKGTADLVLENDGWTISTRDGKISALFEDTVAVTANGAVVLTS